MKRIQYLFNTLKTNWSDDPEVRGAAKMSLGRILIAEGLFGVFGRSKKRSGRGVGGRINRLLVELVGVFLGSILLLIGLTAPSVDFEDQVITQGQIVDFETIRDYEGMTMHSPVYAFVASGLEYRFTSNVRTNIKPNVGKHVEIAYSQSNPNNARRTDGLESKLRLLFMILGFLFLIISTLSLVISISLVILGIILFRKGRIDLNSEFLTRSLLSDFFSIIKEGKDVKISKNEKNAEVQRVSEH